MPPSLKGLKSFFGAPKGTIKLPPMKTRATSPTAGVPSLQRALKKNIRLSPSPLYPDPTTGRLGQHPRVLAAVKPAPGGVDRRTGLTTFTPKSSPMSKADLDRKHAVANERVQREWREQQNAATKHQEEYLARQAKYDAARRETGPYQGHAVSAAQTHGTDAQARAAEKHAANIKKLTEQRTATMSAKGIPTIKPSPRSSFSSDPTGASDKLHAERKAAQVAADAANDARLKGRLAKTESLEDEHVRREAHRTSEKARQQDEADDARLKAQLARQEGYKAKEKAETLRLQRQKDRERERQRSLGSGPDPRGSAFEAFGKKRR